MKILWSWLNELIALPWSPEETAEKLTMLGFPLEALRTTGASATDVIAAKIVTVEKHPNADRLSVARVHDGKSERVVVCGAPNIAPGQIVPLAVPGARLGDGSVIQLTKIRGVESSGMLCSERELGLSEDHAGILQLPADVKLGVDVRQVIESETVFDFEIPPNRPDGLSHVGIARELARLIHKTIERDEGKSEKKIPAGYGVKIEDKQGCPRYIAREFVGVRVQPSPAWVVRRLTHCGIRSINNIVDITNYVLLEWGHPLHAFDGERLQNDQIIVRRARAKESLRALDGKIYPLSLEDLVIADGAVPVAIAGIMGGEDTGVTEATRRIVLESAVFDPSSVRASSRRLGLKSESSIRFERGSDPETARLASGRAARLIAELSGGKPKRGADAFPSKPKKTTIDLSHRRVDVLGGIALPADRVQKLLTSLDFSPVKKKDGWRCVVPFYRKDVQSDADVVEDIVRLIGYDQVPDVATRVATATIPKELSGQDFTAVSSRLRGFGLHETLSSSFCPEEKTPAFGFSTEELVHVANPLNSEEAVMRPTLIVNLLRAVQKNVNQQRSSVALFEIGKIFSNRRGRMNEQVSLAMVVYGEWRRKTWSANAQMTGIFHLKGLLEGLSVEMREPIHLDQRRDLKFLHPMENFDVRSGGRSIGWAGVLHPSTAAEYDLRLPCVVAEIDAANFGRAPRTFAEYSRLPFVERDIAVVVDKTVPWERLQRVVWEAEPNLLKEVMPFDVFAGGTLAPGKKSVAFRVRLQPTDKTLTDKEIASTTDRITAALRHHCGADLR